MTPELGALAVERLSEASSIVAPAESVARALEEAGLPGRQADLEDLRDGTADAVALLDDELSRAGQHAEGLLAETARVLRGGGMLLAGARSALHAAATGSASPDVRAYTAGELGRLLGHRGFAVELVCAPGAASRLRGSPAAYEPELDGAPGLLDAAPQVAAVGRLHPDEAGRSAAFFASLPRKIVAAAVVCRDAGGRLLLVHDTFKGYWTIPGGVVDAGEAPRAGAERETWEESGLRVSAGRLLGLFSESPPDRMVLIYDATPVGEVPAALMPVHAHEIDAVEWRPLDEALARLNPRTAGQLRRCLSDPGGTWHHPEPPRGEIA